MGEPRVDHSDQGEVSCCRAHNLLSSACCVVCHHDTANSVRSLRFASHIHPHFLYLVPLHAIYMCSDTERLLSAR